MSTRALYLARGTTIDLANIPRPLYDEIVSWHGRIAPPPAPPVFTCLGNGKPLYVVHHQSGRYFLRHYRGDNPDQHEHPLSTMSDEHRRQAEYTARAATDHGLDATLEKSTGNGTILDVAVIGAHNIGFEIQRSPLSRRKAQSRAEKSFTAGYPTAWVTDRPTAPDWLDYVPSAQLTTRGGWDAGIPPRNTAYVSISEYTRERDRTKPSGWRYQRSPIAVPLDQLSVLMPAEEIVPVAVGTRGQVVLAFKDAVDVIDSCTYPGASLWRPSADTRRFKEAAQTHTHPCVHERPAAAAPTPTPPVQRAPSVPTAAAHCRCGTPLWRRESIASGQCLECRYIARNVANTT